MGTLNACAGLFGLAALLGASTALAGPKEDVVAAYTKAFERGAYRAEITTEVRGKPYVMQIDVKWPDHFHMKNPDTEMIILPGATWMNAGGQWMNMPMDMSKMIQAYSKPAMEEGVRGMGEVTELGLEEINGCSSQLYSYSTSGKFMGIDGASQAELAICKDNGLPVRLVSRDKKGQPQATIHYDFEADINIVPPR
ncbi:hypothetical protein [Pseudomarimonas arenosa]|uniref:Outer membrane lipoprotein-sorting protein n=1 Tax=Pseudomarimonas arenosa TaxID=2774145 RepID=A0AAW3ZEQ2_9GAMM|nr:hypothetical protein [Pseudomarimonas arenosa]MBD8524613.1 hypothetical protein [Pseudomarimonas arenosa]